jgi:enoyl-[acyl-carrier-protein] reductase (NADH)
MHAGYGAERFQELSARYAANAPLKSTCKPEDVAETICWLLEGGKMITGETIFVDAGFHLATPR